MGKTIFSLSLTLNLLSKGKKVLYNHFDQEPNEQLCNSLGIPFIKLTEEECLKAYINKKLNSKIIGNWVVKAPFLVLFLISYLVLKTSFFLDIYLIG